MIGGLFLVGCGLAVLAAGIFIDALIAWTFRKWVQRHD